MKEAFGGVEGRNSALDKQIADRRTVGKTTCKLGAEFLLFARECGVIPFTRHIASIFAGCKCSEKQPEFQIPDSGLVVWIGIVVEAVCDNRAYRHA